MFLIIGLGNPGVTHERTRHNFGRMVAGVIASKHDCDDWRHEKKFFSLVVAGKIGKENIEIALPETFMNKSGHAANTLSRFYKIKPDHVIVLHDDADLPLGRVKFSFGKRSAGHKGVESVKRAIGTWGFWRIRLGIQKKKRISAEKLVLKKFTSDEEKIAKKIAAHVSEGLDVALAEGFEKAMSLYSI